MSNTATTNLAISLKTNGKWFALTGSVVSFVGDVLLPLAPVVSYVFWVSLGFGVSSLVLYLALRGSRSFIAPVCTFSIIVAAMTGTMYALQETQQGNSGVLAAAIPALQDLQKSLSIVGADVAEIKRVAKVIDARTDVIQKSTERISDTLGKMDRNVSDKLNDIHRNVGNLGKLGGLVDNPTTAAEFYNNAIVHEKRGNRGAALEAYEAYFALAEEEYFDPYVDYIKLLETAYSQSKGERQLAALAKRRPDSVSLRLAGILFKGERDMTEQIRRLLREAPDYVPAYVALYESLPGDTLLERVAKHAVAQDFAPHADTVKDYYLVVDDKLVEVITAMKEARFEPVSIDFDYSSGEKLIVVPKDSQKGDEVIISLSPAATAKARIGAIAIYPAAAVFHLRAPRKNKTGHAMTVCDRLAELDRSEGRVPRDCSQKSPDTLYDLTPGDHRITVEYFDVNGNGGILIDNASIHIPAYTAEIRRAAAFSYDPGTSSYLVVMPYYDTDIVNVALQEQGDYMPLKPGVYAPAGVTSVDSDFYQAVDTIWGVTDVSKPPHQTVWVKAPSTPPELVHVACGIQSGC